MKYLRLRLRTLILLVAGAGLVTGLFAEAAKRRRYRALNERLAAHAERETYWRDQEGAMIREAMEESANGRALMAQILTAQAAYNSDQVQYHGALRRKYEYAVNNPSSPLGPDPPAPRMDPAEYLPRLYPAEYSSYTVNGRTYVGSKGDIATTGEAGGPGDGPD